MVNPMLWFAVSVLICVRTNPDLRIHNSEVLSMLAPMLVSGGKKMSTILYSNKRSGTESHSNSTKVGSGVIDSKTPSFLLREFSCPESWTERNLVVVPVRPMPAATAS